jgi:hypothetical protein
MHPLHSMWLDEDLRARWQEHVDRVPWAHYTADPRWAGIEHSGSGVTARRVHFFWLERDEQVCLTAIGVRRQLPIPGRAFWEFNKRLTFLDSGVFDEWLAWLIRALGHDAVRLRVAPPVPLESGGDDVESILERHGFERRRMMGMWATLCVDLERGEDELLASFRSSTRAKIRKSMRRGIMVAAEDTPDGIAVLHALQAAMLVRTPVASISPETLARISRFWLAGGSGGTVLVARENDRPLAAILVVKYRDRAYLHMMPSASRGADRGGVSTSHLLLWHAMLWARGHGCNVFDLGGYSLMAQPGDPLWGVNFFKRGFAPDEAPNKVVAIHERVSSALIDSSARVFGRAERAISRGLPHSLQS